MDLIRLDGVECGAMVHQDPIVRKPPGWHINFCFVSFIYLFQFFSYVRSQSFHVQTFDIFNLLIIFFHNLLK